MANGYNNDPKGKFFQQPSPPIDINRSHFQAMNNLRNEFEHFQSEHEKNIRSQMEQIKTEHKMWDDFRNFRSSQHYEEEIDNVNHYLSEMDKILREKEEMMSMMRSQYDKLRS